MGRDAPQREISHDAGAASYAHLPPGVRPRVHEGSACGRERRRIARRHDVGFDSAPLSSYRVHSRNLSRMKWEMTEEWAQYLLSVPDRFPGIAPADADRCRKEAPRRFGDAAWHALGGGDFAAADRPAVLERPAPNTIVRFGGATNKGDPAEARK